MNVTLIIFLFALIAACSVGPFEDPAENMPDAPKGPGLFSGDKGEFSFSDIFDKKENQAAQQEDAELSSPSTSYGSNANISIPAIDSQSFEDFETFKAWRRASQPDSVDYQEFQDWKAYQQYRRFKSQQQNQITPQ